MIPPSAPNARSNKPSVRNWAWVWLGYSGFLFLQPVFQPAPGLWFKTILAFLTFVAIFTFYTRSVGDSTRRWVSAATFLLGLLTFPWNTGGSCFFIYTAAFLPFAFASSRVVVSLFAAESLLVLAEAFFLHNQSSWINAALSVFMLFIIGGGNIFAAEQKRAQSRLAVAQQENLALAALAERERIARDLHDVLGHTLSVIVLKAELAGRLLPLNTERAGNEIADVERIARSALVEVREAIGGYRARGLAAEIDAARLTLDAAGVALTLDSDFAAAQSLSPQEETALSLALREAVTNIVRHARASECRLRFFTEAGHRRLVVEDNGRCALAREGNGLRGMRERIEFLGGQLSIEANSAPAVAPPAPTLANDNQEAAGTRLVIDLPLQPQTSPRT